MRVKLKDLHPNPYRNMEEYPVDAEKIDALKQSINKTGFWDNLIARDNDGAIELAYGHHRLVALMDLFDGEHEMDLTVRDFSNVEMLQIMVDENMDEYHMSPAVLNETVRTVRDYLNEQLAKDEIDPRLIDLLALNGRHTLSDVKNQGVGQTTIMKFLNNGKEKGAWKQWKIQAALNTIIAIDNKEVSKVAVEQLNSGEAATHFTQAIKRENRLREGGSKNLKKVSLKKQEEIASGIVEKKVGRRDISAFVVNELRPNAEKPPMNLSDYDARFSLSVAKVIEGIEVFDEQFSVGNFLDASTSRSMMRQLKELQEKINNFIVKTEKNEK